MAGMSLPLRPIKRNKSNLGGLVKIAVYTLDQFTFDAEWPKRSDIAAGVLSTAPPLIVGEKAARIIFDIETGARLKADGKGPTTNKNYEHQIDAVAVAGHESETEEALDNIYNNACVLICTEANGDRYVAGSTFKPINLEDDYDSGATSGNYRGTKLKGKSLQPLDFRPPKLATSVVLAEETMPAQV